MPLSILGILADWIVVFILTKAFGDESIPETYIRLQGIVLL